MTTTSKVAGIVQIDGTPAERTVRAFGYAEQLHTIDGDPVTLSKSLGHATSDPSTGEYAINLLNGYDSPVFVVAFDDYGADFSAELTLAVGDRIHPTTPNGHLFECTGAGSLPPEEPAWVVDTETSQLYGTASMIAMPFYRPMVHGPVVPELANVEPVSAYADLILSHFPTGYWRLADADTSVAADETETYNGTFLGDPQVGQPALITDPTSSSTLFDGNGDCVDTGFTDEAGDVFSLEAWVRLEGKASHGRIITKDVTGSVGTFNLRYSSSTDKIEFRVSSGNNYSNTVFCEAEAEIGEVCHFVGVYDRPNDRFELWKNGALVSSQSAFNSSPNPNNVSLHIGAESGGSNRFFHGAISDAAFYEIPLSAAQILEHYEAGTV